MLEGFLVVDKAAGMTSHDVVARVRRATGVRRVGHAGTLDPMATGVLVVAVGRSTRLLRFIQAQPKEYKATAVFGVATDTLDADGAVVTREAMPIGPHDVEEVLPRFRGTISQVPPMVSALKVGGERLYQVARRGETVERQSRQVEVYELEMTGFTPGPYPEASFRVVCGKGTYVRTLVDDVARALGGRAHLNSLRRTRIGSLGLERAIPADIDALDEANLISAADALVDLARVVVDDEVAAAVAHGMEFAAGPLAEIEEGVPAAVLGPTGRLLAVYSREGRRVRPEVVMG